MQEEKKHQFSVKYKKQKDGHSVEVRPLLFAGEPVLGIYKCDRPVTPHRFVRSRTLFIMKRF